MSKIFVIAGTQDQAHQYIKRKCEERFRAGETSVSMSDYVSVSDANKLRGVRDPFGVFIGTWKERTDLMEILDVLSFAKHDPTVVLQIKESLKPITGTVRISDITYKQEVWNGYKWL
jgi:hypothetical protein